MLYCHRTASCPNCGKDSYASEADAFFGTATCIWCGCEFKYENGKYVVVKKERKGKTK